MYKAHFLLMIFNFVASITNHAAYAALLLYVATFLCLTAVWFCAFVSYTYVHAFKINISISIIGYTG